MKNLFVALFLLVAVVGCNIGGPYPNSVEVKSPEDIYVVVPSVSATEDIWFYVEPSVVSSGFVVRTDPAANGHSSK